MNKELERRIEAGCRAHYGKNWDSDDPKKRPGEAMKEVWRKLAADVVSGAFPELFTDPPQAWIAPWEATEEMSKAALQVNSEAAPDRIIWQGDAERAWGPMRDAHLTTGDPLMHGETDE